MIVGCGDEASRSSSLRKLGGEAILSMLDGDVENDVSMVGLPGSRSAAFGWRTKMNTCQV
jgi:hypothetical protein